MSKLYPQGQGQPGQQPNPGSEHGSEDIPKHDEL